MYIGRSELLAQPEAPAFGEPGAQAIAAPAWQAGGDGVASAYGTYGGSAFGAGGYGANSSSLVGAMMSSFMQFFSNFMSQISQFVASPNQAAASFGQAAPNGGPNCIPGQTAGAQQTFYASADANSVGDPHDSFAGTNANGQNVSSTWNNMQGHGDLLSSDSIPGGYRVSTVASPTANGVTHNASATVSLNGGNTQITMNGDGSYLVEQNGQQIALGQGQATSLGNGQSVTLNGDGSLTVTANGAQGGSLATTLAANGGGVDVKNHAQNVDLGGYLAHQGHASHVSHLRRFEQPSAATAAQNVGEDVPYARTASPPSRPFDQTFAPDDLSLQTP